MLLDNRLAAVASLVTAGARVADIGTDHAYLAVELARRGAALVIAADKNAGPCEAARETIAVAGMTEKIPVRQGDGLAVLQPGEVDIICLAGMGGKLIADILTAQPEVLKACTRLVLQPMNDAEALRRWLYANGWHLQQEVLAEAAGQLYVVLSAERGTEKITHEIYYTLGPRLVENKPPLFQAYLKLLLRQAKRAADGMAQSEQAKQTQRYAVLQERIARLEEFIC